MALEIMSIKQNVTESVKLYFEQLRHLVCLGGFPLDDQFILLYFKLGFTGYIRDRVVVMNFNSREEIFQFATNVEVAEKCISSPHFNTSPVVSTHVPLELCVENVSLENCDVLSSCGNDICFVPAVTECSDDVVLADAQVIDKRSSHCGAYQLSAINEMFDTWWWPVFSKSVSALRHAGWPMLPLPTARQREWILGYPWVSSRPPDLLHI